MHHDYSDIRERIAEKPKWWDENAVPRYSDFQPDQCANIYAREAALVLITCQGCQTEFRVAFTFGPGDIIEIGMRHGGDEAAMKKAMKHSLAQEIRSCTIHFGDPPNINCCLAGATMNSEPRRVLEYWSRHKFDWVRDEGLEIDVMPGWVDA